MRFRVLDIFVWFWEVVRFEYNPNVCWLTGFFFSEFGQAIYFLTQSHKSHFWPTYTEVISKRFLELLNWDQLESDMS